MFGPQQCTFETSRRSAQGYFCLKPWRTERGTAAKIRPTRSGATARGPKPHGLSYYSTQCLRAVTYSCFQLYLRSRVPNPAWPWRKCVRGSLQKGSLQEATEVTEGFVVGDWEGGGLDAYGTSQVG